MSPTATTYCVGESAHGAACGHFWRAFRELMAEVEGETATRAFLWSNLFRMDFNNESVLGARTTVVETIRRLQQGLFQDEIAILQPRAIIFFTGPYYDAASSAESVSACCNTFCTASS